MNSEYLEKADENLHAAQLCFEQNLCNACTNRIYYAVLHAAIAALARKGIKYDRIDHKCVQSDFSEKLIARQKVYPAKYKSYLPDMQMVRNIADYTDKKISRKQARLWLTRAEDMIGLIKKGF